MATLVFLLTAGGFYCFYMTSARADYAPPRLIRKLTFHRSSQMLTGAAFLLLSVLLTIQHFGIGSGILIFFIDLMTVGSLIVILAPLGMLTYRVLLPFVACFVLLNLLF